MILKSGSSLFLAPLGNAHQVGQASGETTVQNHGVLAALAGESDPRKHPGFDVTDIALTPGCEHPGRPALSLAPVGSPARPGPVRQRAGTPGESLTVGVGGHAVSPPNPVPEMNVAVLVLCALCVSALAAGAGAAAVGPAEEAVRKTTDVAKVHEARDEPRDEAAPKTLDLSSRVVDGVLSLLGVEAPGAALAELDDEGQTKEGGPGQRGIHKKKFLKYQLWHAFTWWAWVVAVIVIKFKVALLLIWGHLSYFIMALVRMLLRELKRDNGYAPPPVYGPQYGTAQYGNQYGAQYASSSYGPYKRRAGSAGAATGAAEATPAAGSDLAYGAHARR
ncbi:uncharacterized protein LOC117654498 isoform X2 [Thrips palmi]|uniref:Uncharacterized protein LOC117654498 isoform X2 n=1 Tax=Thrips palmi TaxID=161013 RepID=A0A6P9AFI7_THRPL|nr:uncharacterized protein LOC117654498 isoform X2 [Thrips palmi]